MLSDFFDTAFAAFEKAGHNVGMLDRFCTFGNLTVRLRFAGPALLPYMWPALSHLSCEPATSPALTVCLWDRASTGVELAFPWNQKGRCVLDASLDPKLNPDLVRTYFKEEHLHGLYQIATHTLNMMDTKHHLGMFWIPDAHQVRDYDKCTPLRTIVQWWMRNHPFQLVHGGAVGTVRGGVLITGKSGSGKSSTTLACVRSGFLYGGDDYVLLGSDPIPYVYSLYNSCSLDLAGMKRFPDFAPAAADSRTQRTEKAVLFLQDAFPEQVAKGFPIRAVVLPKVVANGTTRLVKASPAACLKALAPSTMFQLPGVGEPDLRWMARFVRKVPGYVLELGKDGHKVPELISGLLSDA